MRGGRDKSERAPLNPEGNYHWDDDTTVGSHRGNFDDFNVRNAQGDYVYYHAKKNDNLRQLRRLNKRYGYQPVGPNDDERMGDSDGLNLNGVQLGTSQESNETILVKAPRERYLAGKRERARIAQARLQSADEGSDLLARGADLGQAHGRDNLFHRTGNDGTWEEERPLGGKRRR